MQGKSKTYLCDKSNLQTIFAFFIRTNTFKQTYDTFKQTYEIAVQKNGSNYYVTVFCQRGIFLYSKYEENIFLQTLY